MYNTILEISIVEDLKKYNAMQAPHQYRDHKIIIHDGSWHFSRMDTREQLYDFCKLLGIEITEKINDDGLFSYYRTNTTLTDMNNLTFWDLSDVPTNATKIKGLSNGAIVDCYFLRDGDNLTIYRPNPNAKNVYKEMEFKKEMEFRRNNVYF